jgi:outer membrane protein OmpA-like peptidoglycan-associated protein
VITTGNPQVISKDTNIVPFAGIGLKYRAGNNMLVRLDFHVLLPPSSASSSVTLDFEGLLSVSREFGRAPYKPAAPPTPPKEDDPDKDGIVGAADKCPTEAEDKDGFQDEDGCPDPDNDGDGLLDGVDKCPGQVGPAENVGCPDTDQDADGVVDRLDNCPTEAGTADNHGCKTKQLVVITKDKFELLDKVYFVTGSAKLQAKSNKLLDNIARVMTAHPEIVKIKVEGHTDNVGKAEKNKKLSQDRATSVVAYLVKKGVDAGRLEAVGHGQDSPVEDNATAKGREANRRVEFNIVAQ